MYIGAIAILIIFAIMLTPQVTATRPSNNQWIAALVVAGAVRAAGVDVTPLMDGQRRAGARRLLRRIRCPCLKDSIADLGRRSSIRSGLCSFGRVDPIDGGAGRRGDDGAPVPRSDEAPRRSRRLRWPSLLRRARAVSRFWSRVRSKTPMVPLYMYLLVSAACSASGCTACCRGNAIAILMSIELMLNAANINLVAFWRYGQPETSAAGVRSVCVRGRRRRGRRWSGADYQHLPPAPVGGGRRRGFDEVVIGVAKGTAKKAVNVSGCRRDKRMVRRRRSCVGLWGIAEACSVVANG